MMVLVQKEQQKIKTVDFNQFMQGYSKQPNHQNKNYVKNNNLLAIRSNVVRAESAHILPKYKLISEPKYNFLLTLNDDRTDHLQNMIDSNAQFQQFQQIVTQKQNKFQSQINQNTFVRNLDHEPLLQNMDDYKTACIYNTFGAIKKRQMSHKRNTHTISNTNISLFNKQYHYNLFPIRKNESLRRIKHSTERRYRSNKSKFQGQLKSMLLKTMRKTERCSDRQSHKQMANLYPNFITLKKSKLKIGSVGMINGIRMMVGNS